MRRRDRLFHCPTCDAARIGVLDHVSRAGPPESLAFRRVPRALGVLTCVGCRVPHRVAEVAPARPARLRVRVARAARAIAASILIAGEPDDPASVHRALQFVRVFAPDYSHADLRADLSRTDLPILLRGELTALGRTLRPESGVALLRQARSLAGPPSGPTPGQARTLADIATHLVVLR